MGIIIKWHSAERGKLLRLVLSVSLSAFFVNIIVSLMGRKAESIST